MIGYSEVLLSMGAMVLFSLILMTSNRVLLRNSQKKIETASEKRAIAIAKSFIDEASTKAFDENTVGGHVDYIPSGFAPIGTDSYESDRSGYDDFDDYDGYTASFPWINSSDDNAFRVDIDVRYVQSPGFKMSNGSKSNPTQYKKMVVTVSSKYLTDSNGDKINITLPYLRRYYKRKH